MDILVYYNLCLKRQKREDNKNLDYLTTVFHVLYSGFVVKTINNKPGFYAIEHRTQDPTSNLCLLMKSCLMQIGFVSEHICLFKVNKLSLNVVQLS